MRDGASAEPESRRTGVGSRHRISTVGEIRGVSRLWSTIGRRLVCKECGVAGSVNIVPNWHDRASAAVPFTKHWKR